MELARNFLAEVAGENVDSAKRALGGGGREGKGAISQFCLSTVNLSVNLLERRLYNGSILLFDFFWALCGQSGFPLAGKVFLSLKIKAWLEWQRTGGLLRTDTESSWNQDGFYLLVAAAFFDVICCLYCSKHAMEQENCGLLLWHEPEQPLESSCVCVRWGVEKVT